MSNQPNYDRTEGRIDGLKRQLDAELKVNRSYKNLQVVEILRDLNERVRILEYRAMKNNDKKNPNS